jgi:hypothetical protein
MSERSSRDGLTLFERIAKSQAAIPEVSANISLTNFAAFQKIIDCIAERSQFGLKYSDGAGVALFDPETMEVLDYYAGETNHTTCVSPEQFITLIKLYLINHREIITPKDFKDYIDMKSRIILLN